MKNTKIDNVVEFCRSEPLEELRQNPDAVITPNRWLEITYTHPQTTKWVGKLSVSQKAFFNSAFQITIEFMIRSGFIIKSRQIEFEYHRNGNVHAHAQILFCSNRKYCIQGLIADIAKLYLKSMPNKYNKYCDRFMDNKYCMYKCPQICISHVDTVERSILWKKYIEKYT